jgi:hypothetical protein
MNSFVNKLPKINNDISFTKQTLSKFYNVLKKGLDNWENRDILMSSSEIVYTNDNLILNFDGFTHIDKPIRDIIHNYGLYHKKTTIRLNEHQYIIHFILPCNQNDITIKQANIFFNKCLKQIYIWLFFVQSHIKKDCSNIMNVHLLFTNHTKKLGQDGTILSTIHANSAFTTACKQETNICIYRKEEWFKVFIHETFHCLGLDFSDVDNSMSESTIVQMFKVENNRGIRVYESYCELWAESLNVTIVSFLKTKTKDDFISKFKTLINKELSFSLFQMIKVLQYHRVNYTDLLDLNCKTIKFKENTHILSYYVLKTILFFNLNKFEKWCKGNNLTLLQFDSTNTKINGYIELIQSLYDKESLLESISKIQKYIDNNNNISVDIQNTMRMSITEL